MFEDVSIDLNQVQHHSYNSFGFARVSFRNEPICVNMHRAHAEALFLRCWHLVFLWYVRDFLVIPHVRFRSVVDSILEAILISFGIHFWRWLQIAQDSSR